MQNILKYYHKIVAYDFKSGYDIWQALRIPFVFFFWHCQFVVFREKFMFYHKE